MTTSEIPVYARDHTLLGICEALGEDLGFNPLLLRVPLAVCLLLNPYAVIATYAGLGMLVLFTRLIAPNPRRPAVTETGTSPVEADRAEAGREPDMALAA